MIQFSIFLLLLFVIIVAAGVIFLTYWPRYGAPFVPTSNKEIDEIFEKIKLKKGQVFCDLGCGDGRMVFAANKITQTTTYGVDINWGLITYCKIITFITGITTINFINQNIFKNLIPKADVYYVYFWPGGVEKIADCFKKQKIKNALVITKSFEIKSWIEKKNSSFIVNRSNFYVYII